MEQDVQLVWEFEHPLGKDTFFLLAPGMSEDDRVRLAVGIYVLYRVVRSQRALHPQGHVNYNRLFSWWVARGSEGSAAWRLVRQRSGREVTDGDARGWTLGGEGGGGDGGLGGVRGGWFPHLSGHIIEQTLADPLEGRVAKDCTRQDGHDQICVQASGDTGHVHCVRRH